MSLSKKTSYTLAVGGAFLAASGFLAVQTYRSYKDWKEDLDCIPWDVPERYTSWKSFFRSPKQSADTATD